MSDSKSAVGGRSTTEQAVLTQLAREFRLEPAIVERTLAELGRSTPIPFLARYRRELTGGLDEPSLRRLRDAAESLRELESRREFVLRALESYPVPDKLKKRIQRCQHRTELEDLYLPFRPRRRTRGSIAKERGLEPLVDALLSGGEATAESLAESYVDADKEIESVEVALEGARDLLAERIAEDAEVRGAVLRLVRKTGVLKAVPPPGATEIKGRHARLKDYEEKISRVPSHRFLALRRAEKEGAIATRIEYEDQKILDDLLAKRFPAERSPSVEAILLVSVEQALHRILRPAILAEVRRELKEKADAEATHVFVNNLHDLLLAPAAGERRVLGIDPSLKKQSFLACVDERGYALGHERIKPFAKDEEKVAEAKTKLLDLCRQHTPQLIALGNGEGSREFKGFLADILPELGDAAPSLVTVEEAGVHAYASGPVGRTELPKSPVPVRAAVSLARRLQDPLAELVKVDAKQIGVGQYQNDVDVNRLRRSLRDVVEHCVNKVGVDVNRASPHLLAYVCGLGPERARAIVEHREKQGQYPNLDALHQLPLMPPEAFEQAAGFLRVRGGDTALDATGVHPEDYPVVERMAAELETDAASLVGNSDLLGNVDAERFATVECSAVRIAGLLAEILDAGRDPRPALQVIQRPLGVRSLQELRPGMRLEGRVTNVTAFGAFVDLGLPQDGLVHVSELADKFVKDPSGVVHVGQVVQVRVLEVDDDSGRIGLTMRTTARREGGGRREGGRREGGGRSEGGGKRDGGRREGGGRRDGGRRPGPRREGGGRPRGGPRRGPGGRGGGPDRPDRLVHSDSRAEAERRKREAQEPEKIPEGMSEAEYMKRKLEELKKRFG